MARFSTGLLRILAALRSPRGRDAGMFLIFLVISAILWSVLALNDEDQRDLRMPLHITHVPDSVTLISRGPEALSVSVRTRGTKLLKMTWGGSPSVNVDFRAYRSKGSLHLSSADLKALVRNATGGAQVNVVYPDSIVIPFTTHPGYRLPVKVDYKVTPGPRASLVGRPGLSADSVSVFMTDGTELPEGYRSVSTEPIRILGLEQSVKQRVRLIGPTGSRVIPDSVDVNFVVEPMIFKSRKVVIEPVNVPDGIKLITFPAQVDAYFMVPMTAYSQGEAHFRVVADYNSIKPGSRMVHLVPVDVPDALHNVQLTVDSAEFIIERH